MWWIPHQCGLMNESDTGGGWGSKAKQGWSGLVLPPVPQPLSPYPPPIRKSRPPPRSRRLLCQPPPLYPSRWPHSESLLCWPLRLPVTAQIGFFPAQKLFDDSLAPTIVVSKLVLGCELFEGLLSWRPVCKAAGSAGCRDSCPLNVAPPAPVGITRSLSSCSQRASCVADAMPCRERRALPLPLAHLVLQALQARTLSLASNTCSA